jgi:2-C-methyl-D-erythritol 2,4-cyclodiphosphate synthase
MRIGQGYDIHELSQGEFITLGGVKIPCEFSIVAHSDGDVILHALCDALLGALALGDIGQHFSDTDVKNKQRDSCEFLSIIYQYIREKKYFLVNADITVITQKPKLAPHITTMREIISECMDIAFDCISIKAKTNEGLDAIGQKRAIAAQAVVLLDKK